eukprot:TRINITY_DN6045_c0_g1_i2.p1 TRINITY_DN6045_c0_g1~~TRINITY_DN6045_c0_g1_i2.p1  ORF type:complete len:239 (-),score=34.25 TRINITY_DN6045_c0_g1_i2:570-1286(-)
MFNNQCSCPLGLYLKLKKFQIIMTFLGSFLKTNEETNISTCEFCQLPLIYDENSNQCKCPEQTFQIIDSNNQIFCQTCQEKFENCNECNNEGCISLVECPLNHFRTLDQTQCVKFCQSFLKGTFNDLSSKNCKNCYGNCPICLGETENDCLTLEISMTIKELQNPLSFIISFEKKSDSLRRQLIQTNKQAAIDHIFSEIAHNILSYVKIGVSVIGSNNKCLVSLTQISDSQEILMSLE